MPIVDNAIYLEGVRSTTPVDIEQTFETIRDGGGFGWIGMYRPDASELQAVADEFGLHPLAVHAAGHGPSYGVALVRAAEATLRLV